MTFCPASMCPLFAADGSPWTKEKNAECPQCGVTFDAAGDIVDDGGCLFYQGFGGRGCDGATCAREQVADFASQLPILQVGPVAVQKPSVEPKEFDCPRAVECQWQIESGDGLCPPRLALSQGIDPRICAY